MSSVTVHIIDNDGYFLYSRSGDINSVMLAVDIEQVDFTMTAPPPPDGTNNKYRWINREWIVESN